MTREEIKRELSDIETIAAAWEEALPVSALERDVVLEKLRKLYAGIKFGLREEKAFPACDLPVIDMEEAPVGVPVPEKQEGTAVPEQGLNPVQEPLSASESASESGRMPVAGEEPVQAASVAGPAAGRELFRPEEIAVRTKLDRRVILSLYGEDAAADRTAPVHPVHKEPDTSVAPAIDATSAAEGASAVGKEPQPELMSTSIPASPAQESVPKATACSETTVRETVISEQHTVVLGEVMKNGEETIADVYAKQNHTTDMASKIVCGQTSGLRKSVGINDKFLLMRDLFGGDAAVYEQTLTDLESMTDLDDALLYIHDRHWNPNCEGMKFLVELLTRKLS